MSHSKRIPFMKGSPKRFDSVPAPMVCGTANHSTFREAARQLEGERMDKEMAVRAEMRRRLSQQGISPEDLTRSYDEGHKVGCENSIKMIYAAVCLALKELYGFGAERCMKVLRSVDDKVLYTLTDEEIIDEVYAKLGITLDFKDPIERLKEEAK